MADFEDSLAPTWENVDPRPGEPARRRAPHHQLRRTARPARTTGSTERTATLIVRPRGWHLPEKHVHVDGEPVSGALFDFGLFFFHNARSAQRARHRALLLPAEDGEPPRGAALERRVRRRPGRSSASRAAPSRPRCSSRRSPPPSRWTRSSTSCASTRRASTAAAGTTSSASSRSSANRPGLPCCPTARRSRWTRPFLQPTSTLLIKTCHRRGVHAMGGMAAQIPIKDDPEANEAALAQGARRQAARGAATATTAPGSRTPASCPSRARSSTRACRGPNQLGVLREDVRVARERPAARSRRARDHRGGPAPQRPRRRPVPRGLAARATAACRSTT